MKQLVKKVVTTTNSSGQTLVEETGSEASQKSPALSNMAAMIVEQIARKPSRYKITEYPKGFRIEGGENRTTIEVWLVREGLSATRYNKPDKQMPATDSYFEIFYCKQETGKKNKTLVQNPFAFEFVFEEDGNNEESDRNNILVISDDQNETASNNAPQFDRIENWHFFTPCPLYNYTYLVDQIARGLLKDWKKPYRPKTANSDNNSEMINVANEVAGIGGSSGDECEKDSSGNSNADDIENTPPSYIQEWVIKQTARALNRRIHTQWRRLLEAVNPQVRDIVKRVSALAGNKVLSGCEIWAELYDENNQAMAWLRQDILKYRACAIACRHAEKLSLEAAQHQIENSPEFQALQKKFEMKWELSITPNHRESMPRQQVLKFLAEWQNLYSPTGKTYPTLNRTLMQLPGNIPAELLVNQLPKIQLERPVIDRVELLFLLCYKAATINNYNVWGDHYSKTTNEPVIIKATREQILAALKRVAKSGHLKLKSTKLQDMMWLVRVLLSYPYAHDPKHGNIVGLVEKSLEWSREEEERKLHERLENIDPNTACPPPPIALPEVKNLKSARTIKKGKCDQEELGTVSIRFLATVSDVVREGASMHHCLANYVEEAVRGDYYFFHVIYRNEEATIQVSKTSGEVIQAKGWHNSTNEACKWGTEKLKKWGRKLVRAEKARVQKASLAPIAPETTTTNHDGSQINLQENNNQEPNWLEEIFF